MGASDYSRVSILKLKIFLKEYQMDIFVRLSETKFIKLLSCDTQDAVEIQEILDSYAAKGLSYLYVYKDDFDKIMSHIEKDIDKTYQSLENFDSLEKEFDGISSLLDNTKTLLINLGLIEATIKNVDRLVSKTLVSFSRWESLSALTGILLSRGEYLKTHSILSSYIATVVAKDFDWATEGILRKIVIAGLFQNIYLEKDEHAMIYDRESEEFMALEVFEKDLILSHPRKGAELLDHDEFTGFEVVTMIKNHHELPHGGGFPRNIAATNLSPLECCLIISSYFSHKILTSKEADTSKVVQQLNEVFYEGNFKKSFETFLKLFR